MCMAATLKLRCCPKDRANITVLYPGPMLGLGPVAELRVSGSPSSGPVYASGHAAMLLLAATLAATVRPHKTSIVCSRMQRQKGLPIYAGAYTSALDIRTSISRIKPLPHTVTYATSVLNHVFGRYSILTLPHGLSLYLFPSTNRKNKPRYNKKRAPTAEVRHFSLILISLRVNMARGRQYTYCIDSHHRR